jgi:serine protease Do
VEGAKDIQVAISDGKDRKTFAGRLVGKDSQTDLAVVKIDGKPLKGFGFPAARLGDSDRIHVGEWAIAIGSPFGLEHTVTVGVISAKRQNVSVEGRNYADLIQTDASINPGNSGGPLVNVYGEVIGINVAIFTPSGGFVGVGFAIPINKAKEVLADLITLGGVERGWLGIKIQELNPDLAKAFKLSKQEGAVVSEVLQGSPAQEGGMKNGDVITGFNGYAVKNTGDLHQMVSKAKPGTVANIDIIREGKKQSISVKIGRVPQEEQDLAPAGSEEKISLRILGLTLQNHSEGVLVAGVESGSIAENAGILEGDVIKEINKAPVRNTQDLQKAVKGAGKNILFLIKRGDATVYIAMNAE